MTLNMFQCAVSSLCTGLQGHANSQMASHHHHHFETTDPYEKLKLRIHAGLRTDSEYVLEDPKVEYLVKSLFSKEEAVFLSQWPRDGKARTTNELAHHYSLSEEEFLSKIETLMQSLD